MKTHKDTLGERPPCFNEPQWRDYVQAANEDAAIGEPALPSGFCTHCTVLHQSRMLKVGKCVYPHVVFVDGEGVRPRR